MIDEVTLVAVVGVLVEVVKRAGLPSRFLPALAVLLGAVVALVFGELSVETGIIGLLLGASAAGLYDVGKKSVLNQ